MLGKREGGKQVGQIALQLSHYGGIMLPPAAAEGPRGSPYLD
jgi:hypothetical protein